MLKDMKEGLSSSRKADTTHIRRSFQIYTCRPCEYGADKYERANFMRPAAPVDVDMDVQMRAAFERLRKYLRATRDHIDECLESMERHQSQDPKLVDVEGMKQAAYAMDTDVTPGSKIGASLLPHVAPACSSLKRQRRRSSVLHRNSAASRPTSSSTMQTSRKPSNRASCR